ncbi:unnamed protein product [marine sediment metagenome]|uniref:Uncharacterized protein n=1 Tax=marine sediment metagenome TaxID=412755 RepID=X1U0G7_9ZZZZ
MSLFQNPMFALLPGLEDTANIQELHVIAEELGLIDEEAG